MPLGEGVARAMERDDARSPLTTTLNNNQLDKATSGGYDRQWRGQARAEREGGGREGGRKQWGGGMGMMAGGGSAKMQRAHHDMTSNRAFEAAPQNTTIKL